MKVGRNDLCLCGSGKKYKKCCYLKGEAPAFDVQLITQAFAEHEDIKKDNSLEFQESLFKAMTNIRKFTLNKKPHIKEYYKIRKMHGEITDSMSEYYFNGQFNIDDAACLHFASNSKNKIRLMEMDFNLETDHGIQGLLEILVYKGSPIKKCITEEFIEKSRYRKPDKIEFLHSMLNSKAGLFEATKTDEKEGCVYLKNVFTGEEYKIIDIGFSGNRNNDDFFMYNRIITHHELCFGSGINLIFSKTDDFIINHIQGHKNDYIPDNEFLRFKQLYNHFIKHSNNINIMVNSV